MENTRYLNSITRQFVIRRDKVCQKCGYEKYLEIHHINPVLNKGEDSLLNCILLCHTCHKYSPNDPLLFLKYLRRSYSVRIELIPTALRLYTKFFNQDKYSCEEYIKQNYLKFMNPNYKKCFWYRNSMNLWEKNDLDDLFDLKEITDFVFGKLCEETNIKLPKINGSYNKEFLNDKIQKVIKQYPNISYRQIGIKLGINHRTVQKNILFYKNTK